MSRAPFALGLAALLVACTAKQDHAPLIGSNAAAGPDAVTCAALNDPDGGIGMTPSFIFTVDGETAACVATGLWCPLSDGSALAAACAADAGGQSVRPYAFCGPGFWRGECVALDASAPPSDAAGD